VLEEKPVRMPCVGLLADGSGVEFERYGYTDPDKMLVHGGIYDSAVGPGDRPRAWYQPHRQLRLVVSLVWRVGHRGPGVGRNNLHQKPRSVVGRRGGGLSILRERGQQAAVGSTECISASLHIIRIWPRSDRLRSIELITRSELGGFLQHLEAVGLLLNRGRGVPRRGPLGD
jgi:hypothetical protein